MIRTSLPLAAMASTHGGMRRILKKRLPVPKFIELAVKAGTYKTPSTRPNYLGLHDEKDRTRGMSARAREEMLDKMRRGIWDFPKEYEILSRNPPLPTPSKVPVRVRKQALVRRQKQLQREKRERERRRVEQTLLGDTVVEEEPWQLPTMDRLVKSYVTRQEDKLRNGMAPDHSKREEEYYSQLLLGPNFGDNKSKFLSPSSLSTAMGRKTMVIENAYAFALRQQQVMMQGGIADIRESAKKVEELLKAEAKEKRHEGRNISKDIQQWRGEEDRTNKEKSAENKQNTVPSILHNRPRAIRALGIWSMRLQAVPYDRWTLGASTALDHWIAREVLQMEELTWQQVLEGGGTDAYLGEGEDLPGGETKLGIMDRIRDIVTVRGALFPETLISSGTAQGDSQDRGELKGDLDDLDETNRSIDALLASLGQFDNDTDGDLWKLDEDDKERETKGKKAEASKETIESIMDELQVWRERYASSSYEYWDADRKAEFDQWMEEKYIATLTPESSTTQIDMEETRTALLSQRPIDKNKTQEFWNNIRTKTEAELFLQEYRSRASKKLQSLTASSDTLGKEEKQLQSELEAILTVPFDRQLRKIMDMGTLRPILDEYSENSECEEFFEKHSSIFLEGLELEHLVPDPKGSIQLEDLSTDLREELSEQWSSSDSALTGGESYEEARFAIRMIPYGTDEFGTSRAERARHLYRLWNEHKASRATFEEALFKKGLIGLEQRQKRRGRKKND